MNGAIGLVVGILFLVIAGVCDFVSDAKQKAAYRDRPISPGARSYYYRQMYMYEAYLEFLRANLDEHFMYQVLYGTQEDDDPASPTRHGESLETIAEKLSEGAMRAEGKTPTLLISLEQHKITPEIRDMYWKRHKDFHVDPAILKRFRQTENRNPYIQ